MQWATVWGVRLTVIVAVAAYIWELVREARAGLSPFEALPLQLVLACPTILLLVLGAVAVQQQLLGGMTRRVRRLVFWVPRIALLAFAAFISLFALDMFGAGYAPLELLLGLLIHLIPTGVLLVAAALAWRHPWVGAIACTGWAAWYLSMTWGQSAVSIYALMAGAPLLVGLLFALDWGCPADQLHPPRRATAEV
jgi:hypothetical protein